MKQERLTLETKCNTRLLWEARGLEQDGKMAELIEENRLRREIGWRWRRMQNIFNQTQHIIIIKIININNNNKIILMINDETYKLLV